MNMIYGWTSFSNFQRKVQRRDTTIPFDRQTPTRQSMSKLTGKTCYCLIYLKLSLLLPRLKW